MRARRATVVAIALSLGWLAGCVTGPARRPEIDVTAWLAAQPPSGAWARAAAELARAGGPLVEIDAAALPSTGDGATREERLAALAARGAARVRVVIVRDGVRRWALFPGDALAPFVPGLAPVLPVDERAARDPALGETARLIDEALGAAARGEGPAAARAADRLQALVDAQPAAPGVLRAREALRLLGAAGLTLTRDDAARRPSPTPSAPARPSATPYEAWLRTRTATDVRAAFSVERKMILRALPADRREAIAALFDPPRRCGGAAAGPTIPVEDDADLVLAPAAARALALAAAAAPAPTSDQVARAEAIVARIAARGAGWSYAAALIDARAVLRRAGRGDSQPYRVAGELVARHLDGLAALGLAEPRRTSLLTALGLATHPTLREDALLRRTLSHHHRALADARLAAAPDASALLSAAVAAGAGLLFGAPLDDVLGQLGAIVERARARLRGDLASATGWGAAALHLGDGIARWVTGDRTPPDAQARAIVRALTAPGVSWPALGRLGAAAALYLADGLGDRLDPARPSAAPRAALVEALSLVDDAEAPRRELVEATAGLADSLIAVIARALRGPPATVVCESDPARPSEAVAQALPRLAPLRARLVDGDARGAPRLRVVALVLSDVLDVFAGEHTMTIAPAPAARLVEAAATTTPLRAFAPSIAAAYGLGRALVVRDPRHPVSADVATVRALLDGLRRALRDDGPNGPNAPNGPSAASAPNARERAGLDALDAAARTVDAAAPADALLCALAARLHAEGRSDERDAWLLAAAAVGAWRDGAPARATIDLAAAEGSRFAPALLLADESVAARAGGVIPSSLRAGGEAQRRVRADADAACLADEADAVAELLTAARDIAGGARRRGRARLEAALDALGARALRIPRYSLGVEHATAHGVLKLTIEVSTAAPILSGTSTFQLGLGGRTTGGPVGTRVTTAIATKSDRGGDDDLARAMAQGTGLALVAALLDRDDAAVDRQAQRLLDALDGRFLAGGRPLGSDINFAHDAGGLTALAAALAADQGRAGLAAALWARLHDGLSSTIEDAALERLLRPAPFGLDRLAPIAAVLPSARLGLAAAAARSRCLRRRPAAAVERPTCAALPTTVTLTLGGVTPTRPTLPDGCALDPLTRAALDAEALADTAARLRARRDAARRSLDAGRALDAALLLARDDTDCSADDAALSRRLAADPRLDGRRRLTIARRPLCRLEPTAATDGDLIAAVRAARDALADDLEVRLLGVIAAHAALHQRRAPLHALVDEAALARWRRDVTGARAAGLLLVAAAAGRARGADLSAACDGAPPSSPHAAACARLRAFAPAGSAAVTDADLRLASQLLD